MEIEIISRENIKPSTPTPQNLRNYKISLLDQIMAPIPIPLVLYFPTGHNPDNKNSQDDQFISESTKTLKQSLSKLLTRFHPFGGRLLKDHLSVDCNDEGFLFIVAKIKSKLSDFLKKPDQEANLHLIPCQLNWSESESGPGSHVAMAQVNYFNCGGIAIGFVFSHRVADGVTISSFIKSWSLYAYSGCTEDVCPNYSSQSLFPQNEAMEKDTVLQSTLMRYLKFGKSIMRRYVFDSRAISTIRSKSGDSIDLRPSRVEVVSAFLWKCFISANKSEAKLSLMNQAVNLRKRAEPRFPDNCFGNFLWLAPALTTTHENDHLENLVRKLRDTTRKLDGEFVRRMQGDEGFSGYCKNVEETWAEILSKDEAAELLTVSSWCNFGFYNVDFGWGKPIWVNNCGGGGNSACPLMSVVWLMDTKEGDGIEAWVALEEQYMTAFDDVEELRVLASIDPSPFDI